MAMGPSGGGQRRLTVEVVYALNQASMQQAASAVQTSGIRPLSELGQQAQKTAAGINFLGQQINVGRIVAWGLAWSAAYKALNLIQAILNELITGPFQIFAEMQKRQLALAAEIRTLDPSIPFAQASQTARALQRALLELQPGFIGTRERLQEIALANIRFFSGLNLATQQGRERFLTLANAIESSQIGIARAGSSFREVAALIEGVMRPGAQFLTMLVNINPEIVEQIQHWTTTEARIKGITDLLEGFRDMSREVANTLSGQINRLMANWQILMLNTGESVGPILTGFLKIANAILEAHINLGKFAERNRLAGENFFRGLVGLPPEPRVDPVIELQRRNLRDAFLEIQKFLATSQGMKVNFQEMFRAGTISADEYADKLDEIARVAFQELQDATNKTRDTAARAFVAAAHAAKQYRRELQEVKESLSRAREFEIPLQSERDLFRQVELLRGLLGTFFGRRMRVSGDPAKTEQLEREEAGVQEKLRDVGERTRRIMQQNAAEILRVGQRAFAARMLDLESQRAEELRIVASSREAVLAIEKKFILQRLQILEDARKSLAMAETESAATRIRNIGQQGDLQQRLFQSQTSMVGVGTPLAPESGAQVRARFEQLQAIQQASSAAAIRDAEAQFRAAQATRQFRESATLRAEATARLFGVILQQADAQASLNRQEREALRTAQERDLTQEIRLLERRLALLNLAGGTDVLGTERQLDRAKAVAALRQLSAAELRQELEFAQRGAIVAPPGLDQTIWDRLTDRAQLLLKVLKEVTEEETAQVPALGAQQTQLDGLRKAFQGTQREIQDEAGRAVTKAMAEYGSLFDFVRVQLNSQVDLWRKAGDESGRVFADAARQHLQNVFPNPTGGPGIRGALGGIGGAMSDMAPARSAGTTNIINLGGVDISSQLRPETVDDLIAAVMGARGDFAVARAGRQGVAGPVV